MDKGKSIWAEFLAACMLFFCFAELVLAAQPVQFRDLDGSEATRAAVDFVVDNGLMQGVDNGTFEPEGNVTRAMLVMILYRLADCPEINTYNDFVDVKENFWYTDAIIWAADEGIVRGYGNGRFGPDDPVTRLQLAAILNGYAARQQQNTQQFDYNELAVFEDDEADYGFGDTREYMAWAVSNKIILPRTAARIDAAKPASRLEVAKAMQAMAELYGVEALMKQPVSGPETRIVQLMDDDSYGQLKVEAELCYHFNDKPDQSINVTSEHNFGSKDMPDVVEISLFRNYAVQNVQNALEVQDFDPIFLSRINDPEFTGVTIYIKQITYGRNTVYAKVSFKVDNVEITATRRQFNTDYFAGTIDAQLTDKLIQLAFTDGQFLRDLEVALILRP